MRLWLLARVERLLERSVRESSTATERAKALEGASFRIDVEGLGVSALLRVEDGQLRCHQGRGHDGRDLEADAAVRGTPLDLLRVVRSARASRLAGSGVTLTGRVHVAEQFAELLRLVAPDPEEELSRWVGDLLAHRASTAARGAGTWAAGAFDALRADTAEYLTEEGRLLPTRYEADALFSDIERLRDDVERAEARMALLRGLIALRPRPITDAETS